MSLDLDQRQRAMLQEMGVRVWWAPTAPPASGQVATQTIAARTIDTHATGKKLVDLATTPTTQAVTSAPMDGVAAMDWTALTQAVTQCRACGLCERRRLPVFGGGGAPQRADWLVLGEPVDDEEERQGAPFVGASGQLLDNMLKAVGVSRRESASERAGAESAYVTNCVKCRPAKVRNPQATELQTCENFLRREVALVQPKIILALGRFAAQTLLQGSASDVAAAPLGKLRATVHRYQGIAVVVSYAPTSLLRNPQDKARAWADLCLAMRTLEAEAGTAGRATGPPD